MEILCFFWLLLPPLPYRCVCMCKKCPSYLSMLNCASNKTNSWKGLVSYCYYGIKCIGNFWNMPFVADCIFSFFVLWIWFFNSPCWWVTRLARGQTQIARLSWSKWLWRRGEVMWRTWPLDQPLLDQPLVQPCSAITVWPQGSVPQYSRALHIHNRN